MFVFVTVLDPTDGVTCKRADNIIDGRGIVSMIDGSGIGRGMSIKVFRWPEEVIKALLSGSMMPTSLHYPSYGPESESDVGTSSNSISRWREIYDTLQ
jgi:hypothetical protein